MESNFSFLKDWFIFSYLKFEQKIFFQNISQKGGTKLMTFPVLIHETQTMKGWPHLSLIALVLCFVHREEIIRKHKSMKYKKICRCPKTTRKAPTYIESTTSAFEHQTKIEIDGSTVKTVIHKQLWTFQRTWGQFFLVHIIQTLRGTRLTKFSPG